MCGDSPISWAVLLGTKNLQLKERVHFRTPVYPRKTSMHINKYLPLNCGIEELVNEFASVANRSTHVLIARIINNREQEMADLLDALEQHPEGSEKHIKIKALIGEYAGGGYIYEELKRIDPSYLTPEEEMMRVSDDELDALGTMSTMSDDELTALIGLSSVPDDEIATLLASFDFAGATT